MSEEGAERRLIEEIAAVEGLRIQIWDEDFQHALEGHPEVTIERIRIALKDPLKIVKSRSSNRVCLFYSLEAHDEATGETLYFCVVVGVLKAGSGKMETAYETTYIKTGEVLYERGSKK